MKKALAPLALALSFAAAASADQPTAAPAAAPGKPAFRELEGVKAAETLQVGDKELKLNGIGLRTKAFFKVYVGVLYVEQTSKAAKELIASDRTKRVEMVMLRDLGRGKIVDAVREGFEKNSGAQMPQLKERLDKFVSVIPDLKEGDHLAITYVPGKGTSIGTAGGAEKVSVEGKDFSDALFSVWLGGDPVSSDLKEQLCGK